MTHQQSIDSLSWILSRQPQHYSLPLTIDPPVRGEWAILNPPGHSPLACDLLMTAGGKSPYPVPTLVRHLFGTIPATAAYAWGQPVFAPLAGEVLAAVDGVPDRERLNMVRDLLELLRAPPPAGSPFSAYGGNYVILKCGNVYPLLAHLRYGSLRVTTGDRVSAGDLLGEVGNSGASLQPHLHFQVMSSADPFPLFKNLLPFIFRGTLKRKGRNWQGNSLGKWQCGDRLRGYQPDGP